MRRLTERAVIKEAAPSGPAVYVGTYKKYNEGSIKGEWMNLEDYGSKDEFLKAAEALHKDEADPELMFQDYEGFPKRYYGESSISDKLWDWLALDEDDRDLLEVYIDEVVNDDDATIEDARDHFRGKYKSEEDWAQEFLDEIGGLSPENAANYLSVTDTDARMIGNDEADSRVEGMSDDGVVKEADMEDEYDEASDEQKDNIVDNARDAVREKVSDEVENAIKKDAVGYFVDDTGQFTIEDLMKQNFVSIDYEKYARDAQMGGDMSFVRKDGEVWVFSN